MVKKRVSRNTSRRVNSRKPFRVSKVKNNPFSSGFSERFKAKFSANKNYSYLALLLAFIIFVTLMNSGTYTGNRITGLSIEDVTGAQARSGISPALDMLKDIVLFIFGPDGMLATILVNLTTGANWLPAVAVVLLISVMFYIVLRKSILRDDQHKKATFLLSLALGLLSIGVTIDGQNLVDWFKGIISSTIVLIVFLVTAFALWIFALWGIGKSSKAWGKMHEESTQRLGLRRSQLTERVAKRQEKIIRSEQAALNKIIAKFSASYRNAVSDIVRENTEREFRAKVAKSCPNLNPRDILNAWRNAIS